MDGFPSGQRGQTVNLLRLASVVRIHLHPFGFVPVMSNHDAGVAELADAQDLKSCERKLSYRFDSGRRQYREQFLTVPDFALYGRICSVGLYQDIEILS